MKLSDQIALLRETLEEFGYAAEAGESTGEVADAVIRQAEANKQVYLEAQFQEATQSDKDRIADLELQLAEALAAKPSYDGLCDSCRSLDNSKHVPRLCQNPEAWRQGFSRRGYSVKAGHGCEEWTG
jgi:hypothetical protein